MKPNAVPVREAARLKGMTMPGIYYALKRGKLNKAEVAGLTLVLLDSTFESYTPNPKLTGPRGPYKGGSRSGR